MKMFSLVGFVIGVTLLGIPGDASAQCQRGGGGQGGAGGQAFAMASFAQGGQFGARCAGAQGGFQRGFGIPQPAVNPQLAMAQLQLQQQRLQLQAAVWAEQQARAAARDRRQLDTRRAQRAAELARREARKRAASEQLDLASSVTYRLAGTGR